MVFSRVLVCSLLLSSSVAQPVTSETPLAYTQSSSLRGSADLDSEWTPVSSVDGDKATSAQLDEAFLLEVESALGTSLLNSSRDRVADILKAMRPTFEALDKNEYGKLGHTAVRYALHRLFVARHGWLMKGLDPAGQHFNSSSPVQVLQNKTSLHVQGIFEERLAGQGFGLQELAVFASVLETLISMEVTERLQALYLKFAVPLNVPVTQEDADNMLDLYMCAYILGRAIKDSSPKELTHVKNHMAKVYSFWGETQKLIREVRVEVLGTRKEYSLSDISAVLVEIGERFGKWQNAECQQMKTQLVSLEADEQGCVPLSSFYKNMLTSDGKDWHFGESLDYLKVNGIIDASDPGNLKVMVANYMNAPANCIASSEYYAVCCIDECESLLGQVEQRVTSATATPYELIPLVAALPSSTVPANRTLTPFQIHRLSKIAETHGGLVPIHGRLFMQWMHMVYPRECAYPHMSGTTKPLTPDVYTDSYDKETTATHEEMRRFVDAPASTTATGDQGQCGRWVDDEELFVGGPTTKRRNLHELETDMETWMATSSVALLCVLAVMCLAVIHTAKSMKQALCGGWKQQRPPLLV